MHWLIQQVTIADPGSPHDQRVVDVRLRDGKIAEVGEVLSTDGGRLIAGQNRYLSPGWVDLGAVVGDPGHEQREDLETLAAAAAAGGYTQVAVWPNTDPVIHDKAGISYLVRNNPPGPVRIRPIGALSRDCKGTDITEMMDMRRAGAVAFSDGRQPVQHAGLMMRALLYVKTFDGVVISQPLDKSLAGRGQMHEGRVSTSLGLTGIPALAEAVMVERDLRLLAYTESRLHLANLSTAEAVQKVRAAKAEGLRVTASVPALNLLLDDSALADFDNNCKVLPPLRGLADRDALIDGLLDGTIDCMTSNHVPHEEEGKMLEFLHAEFGAEMLETAFAAANTALGERLTPSQWAEKLALAPRRALGLEAASIAEGRTADLTLFDPAMKWTPTLADIRSKSKNSPLLGRPLKGRPVAVFNREQYWNLLT